MKYCDVVEYNGKKLFSGAIDIDDYLKILNCIRVMKNLDSDC